ncbi:MAG TPA: hypothetical protein PLE48_15100 [Thiobacillus sp.]|nr:MAG: hypothetical protein B7Z35_10760 [Hydrogenophilales bacterium 12-61-10]OYX29636.1 MAG: hypothetical protein B7Z03_08475 [Hydrogenophilales bacterium 32-62-9]OZA50926.1 MAG: hypothetical protein B7X81_00925 [Hydrogenophilales bacterium 17-61-76]HQT71731.1 hypothetical protein [Thiobacillus sp.]
MKSISNVLWALTIAIAAATTTIAGHAGPLPMPPSFTDEVAPETVLRAYPLGNITKQAAFSHHGKAVRSLTLPNGKEGWVYEVGGKQARTYQHPTMEKQTVYETIPGSGVRSFTLVFDDKGVVVDVLYNEQGRHDGLTALQEQRRTRGSGADKH